MLKMSHPATRRKGSSVPLCPNPQSGEVIIVQPMSVEPGRKIVATGSLTMAGYGPPSTFIADFRMSRMSRFEVRAILYGLRGERG